MSDRLPLPPVLLLTSKQAAEFLGVSVGTFTGHVKVAPIRLGRAVRYDRRALEGWAARQQGGGTMITGDDWLARLDEPEPEGHL